MQGYYILTGNMKTAQIMKRDLNGTAIRQNHKTGMFNANDLLESYNQDSRRHKRIDKYVSTKTTKEYIQVIREQLAKKSNTTKTGYLEFPLAQAVPESDVLRSNRGSVNGGTWMHPYLFLDFAMWLSPEFKYQCMVWLHDKLIKFRDEAGDTFKEINQELGEQRQMVYIEEARMINELAFGSSRGGQRNLATEEQLSMLQRLQKADIKLIKKGLTFDDRRKNLKVLRDLTTD